MSTKDSAELATRVVREIEASSRTSRTPPGQSETRERHDPALIEAINQVFALFRLNYHNQYYAAYSEAEQLRQIKKLWLDSLRGFAPTQILQGARLAIESSEYLPTLNRMRSCCDDSLGALGFPDLNAAYLEAANCAQPPESNRWSHAAVYWAGRDCGWQRLATAPETHSRPRFTECYRARCAAVMRGDELPPIPAPDSAALEAKALAPEEALRQLRAIRERNDV